jgi:archaellum component FlaF (FlaF/FlaG flagellin family)
VNWSANGQSGTVTFAAEDTSKTFTVATTDDQVWGTHSPDVTATLSSPTDGAVLGTASANTALTEGDAAPSYSVSSNAASATEGSALTFAVNRSLANGESVANSETVNWSANGQTGTVTFAPGDTTKTFTVSTTDDQVWGTHSPNVTATLTNPTDGAVLGTATANTALAEGDAPPSYSLSSNAASATEGSALTFTVNRSLANGESVANSETVNWSANGQTGTVTFAPGDTTKTFTVSTTDDQVWGTHSPNVTATLTNPTDGAVLGTATANTALAEGDAPPSYSLSSNAASATEGSALTFTVNRSLANGESVANPETVSWSANGQSGTVTFAAGDTSKTFTVATTDDQVWGTHSPNVTATISNPTDGAVLGTATAGTALTEGDPPPSYSLSSNAASGTEGSALTFTVNRSLANGESVANPETVSWSANGQSGTVTFAAGDTSKTFTVATTDDQVWGTHSPNVTATISNPTDGAVLGTATAGTALTEGDAPPSYSVSAGTGSAAEGSALTFTVNRSLANGESVANPETVSWSANGQSGTVTFAAGDTSKTFTVATTDDQVWGTHSPNVTATISNPTDGAVLGTATAGTALTEGDAPPSYSVSAGAGSAAEGSALTFTVNRPLANGESVANSETVNWSANGQSGTLTFAPGDSTKTFTVATTDDHVWGNHSANVTATLSSPSDGAVLGTAAATTALTDADPAPSYSISANAASATEGSPLTFTVNRSLANGESVANTETVNWSANGQSGTVTFAAGDTSKTFTVATTDNHVWGSHSADVTATLSSPSDGAVLGASAATTTLTEGDAAPIFSLSGPSSATKGTTVDYLVTRTLSSGESVLNTEAVHWSASGTAVSGTSSGTLTFAPGDTTEIIGVTLTNANNKSVTVTTSNPSDGAVLGTSTVSTTDPAGITGEPINLGLSSLPTEGSLVTVAVSQVPAGWTLNGGTLNSDGSWSIQTTDVGSLSITAPDGYTGARLLSVSTSWTNSDGTLGHGLTTDNVEVYAKGSPIFALSGDDHLTGSTGNDLFVFSQPIGNDVVYHFDPAADKIDLISYGGFTSFADVQGHLSGDSKGNAVLALADGQSITLDGVQASSLTDANFVFDQTPVVNNAGHMVIADGASMPLSGIISNTGTIEIDSVTGQSQLQLIEHGITLNGGGQVILSDSSANTISGTAPDVTLTNVDNTISGAGQLGAGELTLVNQGTISDTGINALVVDTGPNLVINSGTLEANGTGGLSILSGIENTGTLWADSGKLTVDGAVTGYGNALISGSATLEFGAASSAATTFAANASGTLKLDDVLDFTGTVAGFNGHDQLDLGNVQFGGALTLNYSANTAGTGGTLTVSDGTQTENIAFSGQYDTGGFHLASDGTTGTLITYTPSTLIPLDTTNHVLLS